MPPPIDTRPVAVNRGRRYRAAREIVTIHVGLTLDLSWLSVYARKTQDNRLSKLQLKAKGSPHSITECRVPELIPVLGSQPAGDVSHKPDGRLPLLSARPAVTPATLKRAATSFAAW